MPLVHVKTEVPAPKRHHQSPRVLVTPDMNSLTVRTGTNVRYRTSVTTVNVSTHQAPSIVNVIKVTKEVIVKMSRTYVRRHRAETMEHVKQLTMDNTCARVTRDLIHTIVVVIETSVSVLVCVIITVLV